MVLLLPTTFSLNSFAKLPGEFCWCTSTEPLRCDTLRNGKVAAFISSLVFSPSSPPRGHPLAHCTWPLRNGSAKQKKAVATKEELFTGDPWLGIKKADIWIAGAVVLTALQERILILKPRKSKTNWPKGASTEEPTSSFKWLSSKYFQDFASLAPEMF